tara:strand:- start:5555 stop:6517 length:963 start_codon:yes stop_codon:yes gene_type:complete
MSKIYKKQREDGLSKYVYCTVDGALVKVVYKSGEGYDDDGGSYSNYSDLKLTNNYRVGIQNSLKATSKTQTVFTEEEEVTKTTPQLGTITTKTTKNINPVCIFNYNHKVFSSGGSVSRWISSYDSFSFSQSTSANMPTLGKYGKGITNQSPIYFSIYNSSFMSLNSAATLSGDFTMFLYVEIIGHPVNKYMRFLGKSDDNNVFFSAGDIGDKSYKLSFDSSNSVTFDSSTFYYSPSSSPLLITVIRSKDQLTIRENGVSIGTQTCPTSDFVFDQLGRTGNIDLSFNGGIWHFSAYDGALDKNLTKVEESIIKLASQSKSV